MTYRARQFGAVITEVPIKFVDREAGESKMSSFIVVEALGLVTYWGLGRIVRGAQHVFDGSRKKAKGSTAVGAGNGAAASSPTGASPSGGPGVEDPVRSA